MAVSGSHSAAKQQLVYELLKASLKKYISVNSTGNSDFKNLHNEIFLRDRFFGAVIW